MHRFFATCPKGIEFLLALELGELGAGGVREARNGAWFEGDLTTAYRACLWSRVASRILMQLADFPAEDADSLYAGVAALDWASLHEPGARIAVNANGTTGALRNTHFTALKVKDAVVDALLAARGERPQVDTKAPDLALFVLLRKGRALLSLDLAGRALHRRGYRVRAGEAPLRENLAAALLIRAGWPGIAAQGGAFFDPMCGAGTLPVEAAMIAADAAPGLLWGTRGPRGWQGHDRRAWHGLMVEAADRREAGLARMPVIAGSDRDAGVIAIARTNAQAAGLDGYIRFETGDVAAIEAPAPHGLLLTNPPYGERIAQDSTLIPLYAALGERLRAGFGGWRAAVLTPAPELGFHMGLRSHRQGTFYNGAIECRLLEFEVREQAAPATPRAEDFVNRLRKNHRRLGRWARREGIDCWRVYDADLPEYALAVDLYGGFVHVQEYAPPKTVDPERARARLDGALAGITEVLGVPPGNVHLKRRMRGKGGARYGKLAGTGELHEVREGPCRFLVNFTDHIDTGLFLDHRPVREYIRKTIDNKTFLNLFSYTGTATVHAALGGAESSTSVDMSRTYIDWAGRNFALNGVDPQRHRLVQADCLQWLDACRDRFDLVLLDPPTFSSSKRMEGVLDLQRDHVALIRAAMRCVATGGELLFSTNHRKFRLDAGSLAGFGIEDISAQMLPEDFKRNPRIHRVWRIREGDLQE